MNRFIPLFVTIASLSLFKTTDAQTYNFSHFSQAYSSIQGGTPFEVCDEEILTPVTIGFNFPVMDMWISTLQLHQASMYEETTTNGDEVGVQFFPFGASYGCIYPTINSEGFYKLTGNAGNRIFTVEWKNLGFSNDTLGTQFINFQVRLFEVDGAIEYHFGPGNILQSDVYFTELPGGFSALVKFDVTTLMPMDGSVCLIDDAENPSMISYDNAIEEYYLSGDPQEGKVYRFSRTDAGLSDKLGNKLEVFPNPVTEYAVIETTTGNDETILLTDCFGRILSNQITTNGKLQLNLSKVDSGTYFVRLPGSSQSVKIIKR